MATQAAPQTRPSISPSDRLPGERFWWVAPDGTLLVRARITIPALVPLASGRVCDDTGLGVIESCAGRDATLGLVSAGLVELLARRFPGVRWAVVDRAPTAVSGPAPA